MRCAVSVVVDAWRVDHGSEIEGVLHEYTSIVQEDVVDILLNLKQVAVRMNGDIAELRLSKKAPARYGWRHPARSRRRDHER